MKHQFNLNVIVDMHFVSKVKPQLKPRPKHPIKVHVWAAISKRGATKVCIFEGKMNADFYIEILSRSLSSTIYCWKICPDFASSIIVESISTHVD